MINSLYSKANKERPANFFRFPYGDRGDSDLSHGKEYQEFLRKLGYSQPKFENVNYDWVNKRRIFEYYDVYWTYDSEDYKTEKGVSDESILEKMDLNIPEYGKSLSFNGSSDIILVHDHLKTKDLFIKMIDKIKLKGFEFKLPKFK